MTLISISLPRLDGGTQSRATLNDEVIADYADKYSRGIFLPDIILFYDGADHWLADGFHRVHGAKQAGLKQINADVRQGTRRDAVLYSVSANTKHGLPPSREDKRRAAMLLLNDSEWGYWSDREIGRRCDLHHETVGRIRKEMSLAISASERTYVTKHGTTATMQVSNIGGTGQPVPDEVLPTTEQVLGNSAGNEETALIPDFDEDETVEADVDAIEAADEDADDSEIETVEASVPPSASAPETPAPKPGTGEAMRDELREKGFGSVFRVVRHKDGTYTAGFDSDWRHHYQDALVAADNYDLQLAEAGYEVLEAGVDIDQLLAFAGYHTPMVHFRVAGDSDEYYTPEEVIVDVRRVLSVIDLDPASCAYAQQTVQAHTYYDRATNGLNQPWWGKVWLNPPYSMPLVQKFTEKLIGAYQTGQIDEAIVVVNNRADAGWCQQLIDAADLFCLSKRINFERPGLDLPGNRQGQIFSYFGPNSPLFYEVFRKYGRIARTLHIEDLAHFEVLS